MKFDIVGFLDDNNNYVYNTLVIENILNVDAAYRVLIDTGASFPVWTKSTSLLCTRYPQAVETQHKAWLGGFEGEGREVSVWKIPQFILSDGKESIVYEGLHVAVYPMQTSFDMVVSFPMLRHAILTYITPGNRRTPELQISCSRSVVLSNPRFAFLNGKRYMSGVYVYMQNDYTLSKLIHDSSTLIAVMEKHADYEEWFNKEFPNGAESAEEVIKRLEMEELQYG